MQNNDNDQKMIVSTNFSLHHVEGRTYAERRPPARRPLGTA